MARASIAPFVTAIATEPGALTGGFAVAGGGAAGCGRLAGGGALWHAPKTTNPTTNWRGVESKRG
jgi:hypothetical protein